MKIEKIKNIILKKINLKKLYVNKNSNNYYIIAISDEFKNLSLLERQKIIYRPLTDYIKNKSIHSLSIDTFTSEEWKFHQKYHFSGNNIG